MNILPVEQYDLATPKLSEVTINNLFARAVLEKHVVGKVYVDSSACPKGFYVIHPCGMSLLYGDVSDDFLQSGLKDYLLGCRGFREAVEWLQVFPAELERRIDHILGDKLSIFDEDEHHRRHAVVIKHKRVNFVFNNRKYEQFRDTIDLASYNFSDVDADLFDEFEGSVVPNKFWDDASSFLSGGVGFSLTVERQEVAIVFSAFLHEGLLELGMESKSEFRRRGFASVVSAKLIEYCLEHDLEPVWSCRQGNQGSYNLAIKLGFEPVAFLPYYELM